MRRSGLTVLVSCLLCWFLVAPSAMAATELVNNGNFATKDFTGWTLGSNFNQTYNVVGPDDFDVPTAKFGQWDSIATMSQTLATTVGNLYNFSFQLSTPSSGTEFYTSQDSYFAAAIGVVKVYSSKGPVSGTYNFATLFTATSNATDLTFSFYNYNGYYYLQNVSVQLAQSSIAAPGPIAGTGLPALMGALAIVGLAHMRRSSRTMT